MKQNYFQKHDLIIGAIGIRLMRKLKQRRNEADVVFVDENLTFGGMTNYEKLSQCGITSILDLREEEPHEKTNHLNIKYLKIGIPDGSIPTSNQISEIIKWVKEGRDNDDIVFVHCNLGRGRATLVTILCLISDGISLEQAMTLVKKRSYVYLNKNQLKCVKNFESSFYKKQ